MKKYELSLVELEGIDGTFECYVDKSESWNGWSMPYFTLDTIMKMSNTFVDGIKLYYDEYVDIVTVFYTTDMIDELSSDRPLNVNNMCNCMEHYKPMTIEVDGVSKEVYPVGAGSWCWCEPKMMFKFSMTGSDVEVGLDAQAEQHLLDIAKALTDIGFYEWTKHMLKAFDTAMYFNSNHTIGPVTMEYVRMDEEICM